LLVCIQRSDGRQTIRESAAPDSQQWAAAWPAVGRRHTAPQGFRAVGLSQRVHHRLSQHQLRSRRQLSSSTPPSIRPVSGTRKFWAELPGPARPPSVRLQHAPRRGSNGMNCTEQCGAVPALLLAFQGARRNGWLSRPARHCTAGPELPAVHHARRSLQTAPASGCGTLYFMGGPTGGCLAPPLQKTDLPREVACHHGRRFGRRVSEDREPEGFRPGLQQPGPAGLGHQCRHVARPPLVESNLIGGPQLVAVSAGKNVEFHLNGTVCSAARCEP